MGLTRRPLDIVARTVPPGAGAGGADGGHAGGGEPPQVVHSQFPPWMVPPLGSQNFYIEGNQSFTGATVGAKFTTPTGLASFALPAGMVGWVREISIYVNSLLITSDIQFQLLVGGNFAQGYGKMQVPQLAAAVYSYSPDSVYVPIGNGQKVEMAVTIADSVTYQLSFQVRGWFYSRSVAAAWGEER